MSEYKPTWVPTDKHVYFAIYNEHRDALTVFGTISYPEGSEHSPRREMMTEWGFKGTNFPIIKCHTIEGVHKYYLAAIIDGEGVF